MQVEVLLQKYLFYVLKLRFVKSTYFYEAKQKNRKYLYSLYIYTLC